MAGDTRTIGRWLARRRAALGYSQRDLAHVSSVGLSTIERAEVGRGTPNALTIARLEDALRLRPDSLAAAYRDGTDPVPLDASDGDWLPGIPRDPELVRLIEQLPPTWRAELIDEVAHEHTAWLAGIRERAASRLRDILGHNNTHNAHNGHSE